VLAECGIGALALVVCTACYCYVRSRLGSPGIVRLRARVMAVTRLWAQDGDKDGASEVAQFMTTGGSSDEKEGASVNPVLMHRMLIEQETKREEARVKAAARRAAGGDEAAESPSKSNRPAITRLQFNLTTGPSEPVPDLQKLERYLKKQGVDVNEVDEPSTPKVGASVYRDLDARPQDHAAARARARDAAHKQVRAHGAGADDNGVGEDVVGRAYV
jgi:hypothetical protein